LQEAFDRLAYVLERHRLVFLHFAGAVRRNPNAVGGPTGIYERVRTEEILGHKQYYEQVDSEGEFLFKNRWFLDRYADEAISRFGPGEGNKPDVEGATHPYWSLDETGAGYLQESADLIHACAAWLRSFDTRTACDQLVSDCLSIAYDQGKSRWYSCITTKWRYLTELDEVIAGAKREAVLIHRPGHLESERLNPDAAWYYLRVTYDEAMFNHDPDTLGRVVGDHNYYPVDSGTLTFFKVQGEVLAQRLTRLLDRAVKPSVEREDETRVRVSFSYQRVDAFDEDDVFLIEEEVASAREEVERLDQQWKSQDAPTSGTRSASGQQRRPLSGELLSSQRLYDQTRRWSEKLEGKAAAQEATERSEEPPATDEDSTLSEGPASDDLLRIGLPTAVMAAAGLRDLSHVRIYYPGVIPEEEAKALHKTLASNLKSATEMCKLERIFEIVKIPVPDELGSDMEVNGLMSMLALHHPDFKADISSRESISQNLDAAITKCQQDVIEPVLGILERIQQAMLYDCRTPCPVGDDSFQEPQRFLQLLRAYWTVVRQLVLHHIDAPIGYRPHPLLPLVVNLKARIDECFSRLNHIEQAEEVHQRLASLVDIILSEPDDLSVVPEWSYDQVGGIDRFIEEARLTLGAKSYRLTPAEEMCLSQAQKAVDDFEGRVREGWAKINRRMELMREKNKNQASQSPQTTTSTPSATEELLPDEPSTFQGGELVFQPDRVTICGVDICSGPRSSSRRVILELLSRRRKDGAFVAYSGDDLEAEAKSRGAKGTASGWIRDLRDDIMELLRNQKNIICGHKDVVLSGESGYRFSDRVTVQFADPPTVKDITDTDGASDVPNDDVRDVFDVRDDAAGARHAWILQELAKGRRLKAPDVAEHFSCSVKTAQRDLTALKDIGKIEFVGAARTGHYSLRQGRPG
jgi:hypothetical protein